MAARNLVDFQRSVEEEIKKKKQAVKQRVAKHSVSTATLLMEHLIPETLEEALSSSSTRFTLTFNRSPELLAFLSELHQIKPEPKAPRKRRKTTTEQPETAAQTPNPETI